MNTYQVAGIYNEKPHIEIFCHNGLIFLCWREPIPNIGDILKRENGWLYKVIRAVDMGGGLFALYTERL